MHLLLFGRLVFFILTFSNQTNNDSLIYECLYAPMLVEALFLSSEKLKTEYIDDWIGTKWTEKVWKRMQMNKQLTWLAKKAYANSTLSLQLEKNCNAVLMIKSRNDSARKKNYFELWNPIKSILNYLSERNTTIKSTLKEEKRTHFHHQRGIGYTIGKWLKIQVSRNSVITSTPLVFSRLPYVCE